MPIEGVFACVIGVGLIVLLLIVALIGLGDVLNIT